MIRRVSLPIAGLLIAAGLALLANVAWQLWGTGIGTARAQHRLAHQFNAAIAGGGMKSPIGADPEGDVVGAPVSREMTGSPGSLVAHLVIPRIGVNDYVVEGVGTAQLAKGPGHYPGTPPIGSSGNVGIAGHRTTHGAPFYSLNNLGAGDLIYLTNTSNRTFTYRVTRELVVAPDDSAVLDPTPTGTLTLTTCNPRYSAAQRLIVSASLLS